MYACATPLFNEVLASLLIPMAAIFSRALANCRHYSWIVKDIRRICRSPANKTSGFNLTQVDLKDIYTLCLSLFGRRFVIYSTVGYALDIILPAILSPFDGHFWHSSIFDRTLAKESWRSLAKANLFNSKLNWFEFYLQQFKLQGICTNKFYLSPCWNFLNFLGNLNGIPMAYCNFNGTSREIC